MRRLVLATGVLVMLLLAAAVFAGAAVLGSSPDQRLAARAQVRLADLPRGWRTITSKDDGGGSNKCVGAPVVKATGKSSRDFAQGEYAQAFSLVGMFRTQAEAKTAFDRAAGDKVWGCFVAEIKKQNSITATQSTRFQLQHVGVPSVSRELLVRIETKNAIAYLGLHVNVARKHRGAVIFTFMSFGRPALTLAQESLVVRRVVSRLP